MVQDQLPQQPYVMEGGVRQKLVALLTILVLRLRQYGQPGKRPNAL